MTRSQLFTAARTDLATRRGTRDFASVNQIVATKYELLAEHQQAARAHELLATMPREATT